MPIIIRELVIRTLITDPDEAQGSEEQAPEQANVEHIVQECVTQVMQRLREQNER